MHLFALYIYIHYSKMFVDKLLMCVCRHIRTLQPSQIDMVVIAMHSCSVPCVVSCWELGLHVLQPWLKPHPFCMMPRKMKRSSSHPRSACGKRRWPLFFCSNSIGEGRLTSMPGIKSLTKPGLESDQCTLLTFLVTCGIVMSLISLPRDMWHSSVSN